MSAPVAVATAVTFVWVGMVLAISFLETPLKFRAPGVTLPIGLGIGRLVFRALNLIECAFAATVLVCIVTAGDSMSQPVRLALSAAVLLLVAELAAVRPRLTRRSIAVLSGSVTQDGPSSHAHFWYVGLEVAKVVGLLVAGILLLAA